MIRVVIVDDQQLVREGFAMILETDPDIDVVGASADGAAAVLLCRELSPDVVLMDLRMPGMDGIEATKKITAASAARVLILTTFDVDRDIYHAIRAGASGFVLKDARRADLVHAVHAVADGDTLLAPAITRRMVEQFIRRPPPGELPPQLQSLTERETDVLKQLAHGLSNAEIAAALIISQATVKTHVARILTKLAVRDRVQAAALAYETGLVVPGG